MMMNLFSVFDPTSYFGLSLNWFILILVFVYFPMKYYIMSSDFSLVMKKVLGNVNMMYEEVSFPYSVVLSFMSITIFIYLVINNMMGLFPFIFTSTAHPMITVSLGFIMWLSFFIMGWLKNFSYSAAHLVPQGSPLVLSPFMVVIESISHLIRPFTLSIRLAANMMAGHLIIGLLSMISMINYFGFYFSLLLQSVMLVLEFGVSVIQGFVFSILLLLYVLEYY